VRGGDMNFPQRFAVSVFTVSTFLTPIHII
jgi:hypothetical protein